MIKGEKSVYVIGAGGHAKVIVRTLQELGHPVKAVFDDDSERHGDFLFGVPVVGSLENVHQLGRVRAVIAIGDNARRRAIADLFDLEWITLVHPRAYVDRMARLGKGTVVMAGAIVQPCSVVSDHVIVNTNASVDHDCRVEDCVHIAPGASLGGNVSVGAGAFLGLGSVVLEGRHIGAGSILGAGAVVNRDIPPDVVAMGVPAKPSRTLGGGGIARISGHMLPSPEVRPEPEFVPGSPRVAKRSGWGELVVPGSSQWSDALRELRHDFYHLPNYVELCAHEEQDGQPRAFVYRDEAGVFLAPLILRPIEHFCPRTPACLDTVAPYGYASPILRAQPWHDASAFLTRALVALVDRLLEHGVIAAFFRLHPLLPLPLDPLQEVGTLVKHGETVVCDLSQTRQEFRKQTRHFVRQGIEKARQNGLVAEVDEDWTSLDDFATIYTQTMQRVKADDYYFFGQECFTDMRDKLGGTMHLLTVRDGRQVICGGIFSESCRIVQAHLMGTRSGYERSDASKLLIDFVRDWAKLRGNDFLHLGGGLGGENDSLFFFKSGFSKLRVPFYTWRVVVDPECYRGIVARWESRSGAKANPAAGYFPPYRLPPQTGGSADTLSQPHVPA